MRTLWFALKLTLSGVLLAVVSLLLFLFTRNPSETPLLGMAGAFLFLATLLWAKLHPTSREFGLVGVVFSFGLFFVASRPLTLANEYPLSCVRRRAWCEVENMLHALGGPLLAAAPFTAMGLVALFFSIRIVWRSSVQKAPNA